MFQRIIRSVFFEPWHLLPQAHYAIQKVVLARLAGVKSADLLDEFAPPTETYNVSDGVAFIPVQGVIGRKLSQIEKKCGGVDSQDVAKMLDAAAADPNVVGAVMIVDSPGGQVQGTPELAANVAAFTEQKPLIAWTDGTMASAAYEISVAATQIYASESAQVGSIGTYLALLDSSAAFANEGLKVELFASGKYKGAGVEGLPLTDEQKAYFQNMVNEAQAKFAAFVTDHRPQIAAEDMQGQVFWSEAAVARGLVDAVGSLDDAISDVKSLAKM